MLEAIATSFSILFCALTIVATRLSRNYESCIPNIRGVVRGDN